MLLLYFNVKRWSDQRGAGGKLERGRKEEGKGCKVREGRSEGDGYFWKKDSMVRKPNRIKSQQ